MFNKVLHFIKEKQLVEEGKHVLVGVSGGPDSIALLHILHRLKKILHIKVSAVTINHQLRKEAKEDVQYVQQFCERLNIPLKTKTTDVNLYKQRHGVSTQVAARRVRYALYADVMREVGAHYVALGHHGDDQIETMLMALMRSTNLTSFSGIPTKRAFEAGFIIRPLLCVTKSEIEQYCKEHNIEPQYDSSNEETIYTRNAVRKYVVPTLKEYNQSLHVTVQRLVESLQEDEAYLFHKAEELFPSIVTVNEEKRYATCKVNDLKIVAKPIQRRIFRKMMSYLYTMLPEQFTYIHEENFFQLVHSERNGELHFPNNLVIERVYGEIHCYFLSDRTKPQQFHEVIEQIPTELLLPNGAKFIVEERNAEDLPNKRSSNTLIMPVEEVTLPLHIRTRKPGDRMRYKGLRGTKKIKDILIDEKVPRQDRERTYLLTDDQGIILWLIGLRKVHEEEVEEADKYLVCTYKNSY